jgi:peptide/nickel transport system substrate-binding protein
MNSTLRLLLAVVLSTMVAMVAFATGQSEADDEAGAPAQQVTIALSGNPSTLDPHKSFNGFVFTVTNQVYETLVHRSADGSLEPRLATGWEMVSDTVYEFTLREGVIFHDGTPFNAEAVKFSLERLLNPDTQAIGSFIITMVQSVEVVDEYTVRVTTEAPFAPLPAHLSHPVTAIVSPAAAGGDLGAQPVGTGPFVFESQVTGSEIRLSANPDYWGGEPTIQDVVLRVIPEVGTQVVELQAGTIDLMSNVPPERFDDFEENQAITVDRFLGWGSVYLGYNVEHPVLDDPQIRRAVALAIDRESMIDTLREGQAESADTMIPETVFGSNADVQPIPYDPERARRVLQEAGFDTPVEISLNTFETAETRQIATAIQAQLSEIGIDLSVEVTDYGAFARATGESDHALWLTTWGTVTLDADYTLYALLHSSQTNGDNRSNYRNAQVDQWLEEARRTSDNESRRELYARVHQQVQEDLPYLTLYYPLSSYAKRNRLQGEIYAFSSIGLDLREASIQ